MALIIPSQNDIGAYLNQSGNPADSGSGAGCSCGLRAPLTVPNPESTNCDSERPNQQGTQPNDPPWQFTFPTQPIGDLLNRLVGNPAKTPRGYRVPNTGTPSDYGQTSQYIPSHSPTTGFIRDPSTGGQNTKPQITLRDWQNYRQPQARQRGTNRSSPWKVGPKANPRQPVMFTNPRHHNCCTGQSQAAPISVRGALNASGGDTSLLYLNLYSTGQRSSNDYAYAARVGQ